MIVLRTSMLCIVKLMSCLYFCPGKKNLRKLAETEQVRSCFYRDLLLVWANDISYPIAFALWTTKFTSSVQALISAVAPAPTPSYCSDHSSTKATCQTSKRRPWLIECAVKKLALSVNINWRCLHEQFVVEISTSERSICWCACARKSPIYLGDRRLGKRTPQIDTIIDWQNLSKIDTTTFFTKHRAITRSMTKEWWSFENTRRLKNHYSI